VILVIPKAARSLKKLESLVTHADEIVAGPVRAVLGLAKTLNIKRTPVTPWIA
jgi:hypothetical protein